MGVLATTSVSAGEEILTYYGYQSGLDIPNDYPWYWDLKKRTEEEEELNSNV